MMPHPVFLEAVYTDSERHTGGYLAQETTRIIEKLGPEKVCNIMTDNAFTKFKETVALQMPSDTRWMSHHNSVISLLSTKLALQKLCVSEKATGIFIDVKGATIKRKILDDVFWSSVEELQEILRPISQAILSLERDRSRICDILPAFENIIKAIMEAPTITDAAGILYAVDERCKILFSNSSSQLLAKSHPRQRVGLESGYAEQGQRVLVPSL